jgi:N-acetylneuraminic acid mutarotase
VLIAGGQDPLLQTLAAAELYDPANGTFQATGFLLVSRYRHTATLLPSGKVLVVGGAAGGGRAPTFEASAELYDPLFGTWSFTGSLSTARAAHTATLLTDGRVLVTGGINAAGALTSGEIYDPLTGTWSIAPGSLNAARSRHTATLLTNSKVLVVGGNAGPATAEVYDPVAGSWSATGPLPTNHQTGHTATLLPNRRVLVAGGFDGLSALAGASLFHPATNGWTATDDMFKGRTEHTATLLPNGRVLMAGGNEPSGPGPYSLFAFTEEYDPATRAFRLTELLPVRQQATATLLPNGRVLLVGGNDTYYLAPSPLHIIASADLYDEGRGAPASATPSLDPLSSAAPGGTLVVSGGGFKPPHEASSGRGSASSPTNYPLLVLQREGNEAVRYAPVTLWGPGLGGDLAMATLPANLQPGWHTARIVVNGIVSASRALLIQ